MTRFLFLDRGEELSDMNYQELSSAHSPVRLKVLEPVPPFRTGQIIQIRQDGPAARRARDLVLRREGRAFSIGWRREGRGTHPGEILGRVVAVERGPGIFSLERGLLAHLPASWLPRAIVALEALGRLHHPLTPPLFLGSGEACLRKVREKYNRQAEVHQYSSFASQGLEEFEREIVLRYVKPGGRILDIGCGPGREALGLARVGFQVVAIDIAPGMIEAARRNAARDGLDITFRVQSVTELDEPPGSFDAAYFVSSYYHIPGRALRVETLRRIARALTPEGVLVLMVLYRGPRGLLSRSRLVDLLRKAGGRLSERWRLSEPGDGYMREVSDASDPGEPCFFHDFSGPDEVRAELEAARFSGAEVIPGLWVCRKASCQID